MTDDEEMKCMLALLYALRNQGDERNETKNTGDSQNGEGKARIEEKQKQQSPIALPDAVIRDVILSYQPFRPFRVILIRGDNDDLTWNNRNVQNHWGGGFLLTKKREYSLTYVSNRGPLRFRVIELPYLPPKNHGKEAEAETYDAADGVIISCYMSRFFEFCDRYGYHYASSSILEDVTKRRTERHMIYSSRDDADEVSSQHIRKRARTVMKRSDYPMSVVLCANNVDITHVDARLSSIVFRESIMDSSTTTGNRRTTGGSVEPPTSFIENPRHPFSSLARSLTGDEGLEFIDVTANTNTGTDEREIRMGSGKTTKSCMHSNAHRLMPEKATWSNDDDLSSWSWLRAQVTS